MGRKSSKKGFICLYNTALEKTTTERNDRRCKSQVIVISLMGFPPQGSQRKYIVKKHPVKRKPESAAFSWKVEISSQE